MNEQKTKNWSHFESRWRYLKDAEGDYIKDESGATIKYIERCWAGKLVKSADWLSGCGDSDEVVYVLTVGNKKSSPDDELHLNVLLVYNKQRGVIYKNKNNSQDNDLYVDFLQKETGAVVETVDYLPTVFTSRGGASGIKSLDDALMKATTDLI